MGGGISDAGSTRSSEVGSTSDHEMSDHGGHVANDVDPVSNLLVDNPADEPYDNALGSAGASTYRTKNPLDIPELIGLVAQQLERESDFLSLMRLRHASKKSYFMLTPALRGYLKI